MRFAFISDIHGNSVALEAVLEDINKRNIDKIYVLGDLCFRGHNPKRALDIIRSLEVDVIRGNADEWVLRGVQKGEVPDNVLEMMNKERTWTISKLDENDIKFIEDLPIELNIECETYKIHAFHATPDSLFDIVSSSASDEVITDKLFKHDADIYIYAHIHKPFIRFINGKCVINTGSVGLPLDGMNLSSYIILDINENSFHTSIIRVSYDSCNVIEQLKGVDYPNTELLIHLLSN